MSFLGPGEPRKTKKSGGRKSTALDLKSAAVPILGTMRVIARPALIAFGAKHSDARGPLNVWFKTMKEGPLRDRPDDQGCDQERESVAGQPHRLQHRRQLPPAGPSQLPPGNLLHSADHEPQGPATLDFRRPHLLRNAKKY